MTEAKKPTIQIKTSSPGCPDMVTKWSLEQQNVNDSVKELISIIATYTGYVELLDPETLRKIHAAFNNGTTSGISNDASTIEKQIHSETKTVEGKKQEENGTKDNKKVKKEEPKQQNTDETNKVKPVLNRKRGTNFMK
ncbi:TPA: hypothetical protein ACLBZV_005550 [Bacillus cereus]|uniref:hypothetical protein n=1 Tax=Bacillus cereus TaxID=1396 RepID=UPI001F2A1220|nr:hypothetical protein [Bacillus cereus]BCC15202.1 hypothetical protein BCM0074_p322 [Bacillus cereus]HDR6306412.1 hypothetical protein [Bacillus cereus]